MAIFLSQRWRRQPQVPVEIDFGHPLSNGIVYANLLGPRNVDIVRGLPAVATGTAQQPRQFGVTRGFGTTLGSGTTDVITTTSLPSLDRFTTSIRSLRNGNGGNNLGRLHSTTNSDCFYNSGSSRTDVNRAAVTTGGSWYFGATAWATGTWRTTAVSFDGPTPSAPKAYVNGVSQSVSQFTAPSGNFLAISGAFSVGNTSNQLRVWDGLHQDFFVWGRILTEAELRAHFESPYQMLAPIRPIIYSFPSSITIPTLSSATVTDIGTTTARPRVTVTF